MPSHRKRGRVCRRHAEEADRAQDDSDGERLEQVEFRRPTGGDLLLLPIPVFSLSGGDLEGAKMDAGLSFPGQIKQLLKDWRTGFPSTTIDDKDVDVVQGSSPDNTPVKFYFDKKSGLLLRQVRYTDTALGLNPTQIDYDDYRDVSGVKMPFRLTTTWTDGRSTIVFSELRANVSIDAAKFSKPAGNTPQKP